MTRTGVTLIEVMVALLLLTVGAFALAGGIAYGVRARDRALASALSLAAAESWLETWRASPWTAAAGEGRIEVDWGTRSGVLEWRTMSPLPCLAEAHVRVSPGSGRARPIVLATRRFREGVAGCDP